MISRVRDNKTQGNGGTLRAVVRAGVSLAIAVAGCGFTTPAVAASFELLPAPGVSFEKEITSAEFAEALETLVHSDTPRSSVVTPEAIEHTFMVPLLHQGTERMVGVTVGVPTESRLGAGSDRHGPYYLLNHFDQQVIANGAAATVATGLCAIPAVGTASCVAIQAALAVVSVWISQHGVCPENLKGYFFNNGIRPSCVQY